MTALLVFCAWCGAKKGKKGTYGKPRAKLNRGPNSSHGLCQPCFRRLVHPVVHP